MPGFAEASRDPREAVLANFLSYNVQFGYIWPMKRQVSSLRLEPSRVSHAVKTLHRHRMLTARRPPAAKPEGWSADLKQAFLAKLRVLENVRAAAREVGKTGSSAMAERARDPLFAEAWDDLLDPRLEEMETLLIDRTISRLGPAYDATKLTEAAIRHDANLCMWFLESRMPQRYGKGRPAAAAIPASAPVKSPVNPAAEVQRVNQLIAAAEQRIAEAEACLGGDDGD